MSLVKEAMRRRRAGEMASRKLKTFCRHAPICAALRAYRRRDVNMLLVAGLRGSMEAATGLLFIRVALFHFDIGPLDAFAMPPFMRRDYGLELCNLRQKMGDFGWLMPAPGTSGM